MLFLKLFEGGENALRGEYWITPNGTYHVGDDTTHENVVIGNVIAKICNAIGEDPEEFGEDGTVFRCWLNDVYFPDTYGWDEEDPYERLHADLLKQRVFANQSEVEAAMQTFSGQQNDAREFAIIWWEWSRVDGCNVEMKDLSPQRLKKVGDALADIAFEELDADLEEINKIPIRISTYRATGGGRREATIGELIDGEHGASNTQFSDIASSGKDAVKRLDRKIADPYYKGKFGD